MCLYAPKLATIWYLKSCISVKNLNILKRNKIQFSNIVSNGRPVNYESRPTYFSNWIFPSEHAFENIAEFQEFLSIPFSWDILKLGTYQQGFDASPFAWVCTCKYLSVCAYLRACLPFVLGYSIWNKTSHNSRLVTCTDYIQLGTLEFYTNISFSIHVNLHFIM